MSRHLHLDPVGGIAGDMFLGLLVGLGAELEPLAALPAALGLEGVTLASEATTRAGLAATKIHVRIRGWEEGPGDEAAEPPPEGHHGHHGSHRHLADILALVERAALPERAHARARRTFELLFEAEGRVHGRPPEKVHLHEAGADDALVDVLGTCLGLSLLDIESVSCSVPLPVGGGTVRCEHGRLPVPAPAVAVLLEGLPCRGGPVERELITPTGAALLRALVDEFGPAPELRLETSAHGAGSRDMPQHPNVLRGLLGARDAGPLRSRVAVIETTIDDMSPQDLPVVLEKLFAAGALDAWQQPLLMKKGRMGALVTVIARPTDGERLARLLLEASSTLGVRLRLDERLEWARGHLRVETPWGAVRIKEARDATGRALRGVPEFEDCREAAEAGGVDVDEVRRDARTRYENGQHDNHEGDDS